MCLSVRAFCRRQILLCSSVCSLTPVWFPALQKKPEEINRRSADMWSFAILLWELVTREVPFADLSNMEIGMKVSRLIFGSLDYNWVAITCMQIQLLIIALRHPGISFLQYQTSVCFLLSGCLGGFEAHYPTWHIATHLQAHEDMHEWRPSKEA